MECQVDVVKCQRCSDASRMISIRRLQMQTRTSDNAVRSEPNEPTRGKAIYMYRVGSAAPQCRVARLVNLKEKMPNFAVSSVISL
jgi:hypothetical protein